MNLDDWIVPIVTVESICEQESQVAETARQIEQAEATLTLPAFYFGPRPDILREIEEIQLALDFG